jgi:ribosomal protein S18 acetylase RimI-like enzyme
LGLAGQRLAQWARSDDELIFFFRSTEELEVKHEDLQLVWADESHAEAYARDIGSDSAASFSARLADDVWCLLVIAEGKLAHASWVTTSAAWTREVDGYLCPPPGGAYIYESFTRDDSRGRGIYPFALAGIVTGLKEKDVDQAWVAVEAHNEPSIRAIGKAGFEERFRISYRRRLGRLRVDGSKMAHMGLYKGNKQADNLFRKRVSRS